MDELELFAKAVVLANPADRLDLLDRECAGNPELRARMEQLLDAHQKDSPWLDASKTTVEADYQHQFEIAGTLVAGRYKLLNQIGEGGMGSVWMAEQIEPVKRRVAVKLIRPERGNTKTILARFDAERQAIALMDHPHIAKLLDAGTWSSASPAGSIETPFFAMELVKGIPLIQYCDVHQLNIPDRLQLFMQICSAVQHAHQKGIIHRDIKPSNLLVECHDDKPVPKVIDFGLAKATHGLQLTENTLFTGIGMVMGTPLYMSPEQAKFNATDIDTRADIYALGIVLYELLTGTTPLTKEALKNAALDELMKLIREQQAPSPSSRISSSELKPTVSANRQTEPAKLTRFMRGELDWIVMKAISKDRERRYQTASSFAQDIERFLNHEPVTACPPSTGYRLKKFMQRNKGEVIAASLVVLALMVGVIGTTLGWIESKRQAAIAFANEEIAIAEKIKAETAAAAERVAKEQTQKRLKQIEKGNKLLAAIFDDIDIRKVKEDVEPLEAVLAKRLVKAGEQLEGESIGDPLVVASLQFQLGNTLRELGFEKESIPLLAQAMKLQTERLGNEHPETLQSMNALAMSHRGAGGFDLAISLNQETLRLRTKVLGKDHVDTLMSMNNLALSYKTAGRNDLALPLYVESLKLLKEKVGADNMATVIAMNNLAASQRSAGHNELALALYKEVLQWRKKNLPPDHVDTINSLNNLAVSYQTAGKIDLALPLFQEALRLRKLKLGASHPDTLTSIGNLAMIYMNTSQNDLALPLNQESLAISKTRLGADHPETLRSMSNLAENYQAIGRNDLALPLFETTLTLRKQRLGLDHPDTHYSIGKLAASYKEAGKNDLALPLFAESFQRTTVLNGSDHPDTQSSKARLAGGYRAVGQLKTAIVLFEEICNWRTARLGPTHPDTLSSMNSLASAYWSAKQLDKSIPLFEEALKRKEKKLGRQHFDTVLTIANLGVNYKDAGRLKEALPLLEEAYAASKQHPRLSFVAIQFLDALIQAGETSKAVSLNKELLVSARGSLPRQSSQLAGQLSPLGISLFRLHQYTDAELVLRESLAIKEKLEPDAVATFSVRSMVGACLLQQKKYGEAEPFLLQAYEGLKARQKMIPPTSPRLIEAIDRLIQLYGETNRQVELKKFQAERNKHQGLTPVVHE